MFFKKPGEPFLKTGKLQDSYLRSQAGGHNQIFTLKLVIKYKL